MTFDASLRVNSSLMLFAKGFKQITEVITFVDQVQIVATLPFLEPGGYTVQ